MTSYAEQQLEHLKSGSAWSVEGAAGFSDGLLGLAQALTTIVTSEVLTGAAADAAKQAATALASSLLLSAAWVDGLNQLVEQGNAQRAAAVKKLAALPPAAPHESFLQHAWNDAAGLVTGQDLEKQARADAAATRAAHAEAALQVIAQNLAKTTAALVVRAAAAPDLVGAADPMTAWVPPDQTAPLGPTGRPRRVTSGSVPSSVGSARSSVASSVGSSVASSVGTSVVGGGTTTGGDAWLTPGPDLAVDGSLDGSIPGSSPLDGTFAGSGSSGGLGGHGLAGGLVGGAALTVGSRLAGEGTAGLTGLGSTGSGLGPTGLRSGSSGLGSTGLRSGTGGLSGAVGSRNLTAGEGSGATGSRLSGSRGGSSVTETGSAGAGSAGARGTGGMLGGGGGGAGTQEKSRRRGLGGPIAPKLEDDAETGPRSAAAGPGSR